MKTVVAHLTNDYLPLTQTWLYHNQIINLEKYEPIVLAQCTMNLDKFPTKNVYSTPKDNIISRMANVLIRKTTESYSTKYFENIIKEREVKLLHAHFGPEAFRYLKLKNKTNLPMITTFYGYDVCMVPRESAWKRKYAQLFREGELFLTEGNNMKNELIKLGCQENKIIVQHLGIDINKFDFTPRKAYDNDSVTILIAGSFREKKGIIYAIKAFAEVKNTHSHVKLRIIGDGPQREQIETLIKELNLSNSITLLGYQSHDTFLHELKNAQIFMLTSITAQNGDTEGGAPVAIIEAQATGLPVISSYHADIPEVVVDGKSALLAPEKDVHTLTKHLEYLIGHPNKWEPMGKAGRKHIEKQYDLKIQVDKLEQIYNFILNKS